MPPPLQLWSLKWPHSPITLSGKRQLQLFLFYETMQLLSVFDILLCTFIFSKDRTFILLFYSIAKHLKTGILILICLSSTRDWLYEIVSVAKKLKILVHFQKSQSLKKNKLLCTIKKQLPEVFYKKLFLKISQYSQENTGVSLFLIKIQASRPATLLKRDSSTGAFL